MSFGEVPKDTRSVVIGAGPLAAGLGFYQVAIAVFLPLEGISVTNLGLLFTTLGLTTVALSIPFAILSDRYGRKEIMLIGSSLGAIMIVVPALTSNFLFLEISAVFGGAGQAMYLATWNAYLADTTHVSVRAETFSLSFMTFTIASGIGTFLPAFFPLFGTDLLTAHKITFIALGLFGLVTAFTVHRWVLKVRPRSREGILPRKSFGIIMKFSTANLLIGLGAGLIIPLIPTWFYLRFNETDVFSGPLIASANIIMGLTAVGAPRIARRVGLVKGIVMTQAMSTIFLLVIPFCPTAIVAGVFYVIRAVLMNMASPLSDTFLMSMIAEDERAIASSFNVVLWELPNAASTVVGGSLLNKGNLSLPFYLCGALYVTSIVLFYTIFRRTEQTDQEGRSSTSS
ncbi:MAG: MFS transporter [Candidatus Bathyarchaeia archaeon]|jgi:MFS family permease